MEFDFYSGLYVERHPPADRDQLVERRQDEVEQEVLAVRGRRFVVGGARMRGEDNRVERADLRKSSFRRPTPSFRLGFHTQVPTHRSAAERHEATKQGIATTAAATCARLTPVAT